MIQAYRLIWQMLIPPEKRRFALVLVLTVVMSVFEMASVAGILPFMTVLARPEVIDTQPAIIWFADLFGLGTHREVTIGLGLAVFAVILVGMVVRGLATYAQIRFSMMRGYSIAARLLHSYLAQPYVWFLGRNTSEFGQTLLSEVDLVIRESLLPAVLLISNILVTAMIAGAIFLVEPGVAIGAVLLLGVVYLSVFAALRTPLARIGAGRLEANRQRFQVMQEISGGVKEMKVMGLEQESLERFRPPAKEMVRYQTLNQVIGRLPRFALEAVVYGGFIAMVLIMLIVRDGEISNLLPLLGLMGMAGTKLFPSLQQIYALLSSIRYSMPSLVKLHEVVTTLKDPPAQYGSLAPLRLTRSLELADLHFRYPGADKETLAGFSAVIPARSTLGIVGGTGAGKTTVIDIVLGLLTPDAGALRVDGEAVTPDRVRAWQKSLGYVPQHIFLSDDTVAMNIAFGTAPDKIDMTAVERAARVASLHEFVMSEMPQGYQTMVGERGVRLSGGQRQRIGIARALYHDPDVLILDEATSALDNVTERAVMEAVHNLGHRKTVIMIAHRLSTVENCDKILMLENGRLQAEGTYQELIDRHDGFRRMAIG
ncbi:ABC transporter ATP-binding protein [Actibacterium sp. D379-3]